MAIDGAARQLHGYPWTNPTVHPGQGTVESMNYIAVIVVEEQDPQIGGWVHRAGLDCVVTL